MRFIILLCLQLISYTLICQQDLQVESIDLDDIYSWYSKQNNFVTLFDVVGLYSEISKPNTASHPFFSSFYAIDSELLYRNRLFKATQLIYDLNQGLLFMVHPIEQVPIKLKQEYVHWFEIEGHRFVRLEGKEGFFEILYKSPKISLFKKIYKIDIVKEDGVIYSQKEDFFLTKDDTHFDLRNEKSFAKVFSSHKKQIKDFIKGNSKINFRSKKDESMILLAKFCDSILTP